MRTNVDISAFAKAIDEALLALEDEPSRLQPYHNLMHLFDEALLALFAGGARPMFYLREVALPVWAQEPTSAYEQAIAKSRAGDRVPLFKLLHTSEPTYWDRRRLAAFALIPPNADHVIHELALRAEGLFALCRQMTGRKYMKKQAREAIIDFLCGICPNSDPPTRKRQQAESLYEHLRHHRQPKT